MNSLAVVRVQGRLVGFVRSGRGDICVGLCVIFRGGVYKVFIEGGCVIVILETKIGGADEVSEGV